MGDGASPSPGEFAFRQALRSDSAIHAGEADFPAGLLSWKVERGLAPGGLLGLRKGDQPGGPVPTYLMILFHDAARWSSGCSVERGQGVLGETMQFGGSPFVDFPRPVSIGQQRAAHGHQVEISAIKTAKEFIQ